MSKLFIFAAMFTIAGIVDYYLFFSIYLLLQVLFDWPANPAILSAAKLIIGSTMFFCAILMHQINLEVEAYGPI